MHIATPEPGCLLSGTPAIAEFLGIPERVAHGLVQRKHLPTFRIGHSVCANKQTLLSWIAEKEAEAVKRMVAA